MPQLGWIGPSRLNRKKSEDGAKIRIKLDFVQFFGLCPSTYKTIMPEMNEIRNELVPDIYKSIKNTMSAAGENAFTSPTACFILGSRHTHILTTSYAVVAS